jgi:hypothetical protein
MSVVFDEAETAGGLLIAVEAHDQAFDFTAPFIKSAKDFPRELVVITHFENSSWICSSVV